MIDLTDDLKTVISWSIAAANAFVIYTAGLGIDIKVVRDILRKHNGWAVAIGNINSLLLPKVEKRFSNVQVGFFK